MVAESREVRRFARAGFATELQRAARGVAHAYEGLHEVTDAVRTRLHAWAEATDSRLTLVNADGSVLLETEPAFAGSLVNLGTRPEIVAARTQGSGEASRESGAPPAERFFAAERIPGSDVILRLARDPAVLDARTARAAGRAALTFGALVLLVGLFAFLAARRLGAPILELLEAARAANAGRHGVRVRARGADELGRLGRAYNEMSERLEEAVRVAREEALRLQTLLHGMSEGVIALDAAERVYFLNGVARSILGVPEAVPSAGSRLYEIVRDPRVLGLVQAAVSGACEVSGEVSLEGPPRRTLHVQVTPFGTGGADLIVVLRDLSQVRHLERVRSDFVSNVSHELRTPLASIAAAAETLRDDATRRDDEAGPRFLAIIARNVVRLEALLSDILTLSHLESQREELSRQTVDVAQVCRAAAEDLAERARTASIGLSVAAGGAVPVQGDPYALRRIVDNLVMNAIAYTGAGGRVEVSASVEGGNAVVRVRDTGIGIPATELERIFERFYRVDKARSRSAGGTGLGLAIVKHGVKLHGGEVHVESTLGVGSTFTVRIPAAPATEGT